MLFSSSWNVCNNISVDNWILYSIQLNTICQMVQNEVIFKDNTAWHIYQYSSSSQSTMNWAIWNRARVWHKILHSDRRMSMSWTIEDFDVVKNWLPSSQEQLPSCSDFINLTCYNLTAIKVAQRIVSLDLDISCQEDHFSPNINPIVLRACGYRWSIMIELKRRFHNQLSSKGIIWADCKHLSVLWSIRRWQNRYFVSFDKVKTCINKKFRIALSCLFS